MGDSGEEDGSVASSRCNAALRKQLPDVGGDGGHQTDLLPLLVFAEGIPLFSGGETALRAEADLLERHVLRGLGETRFTPCGFSSSPFLVVISPRTTCCGRDE